MAAIRAEEALTLTDNPPLHTEIAAATTTRVARMCPVATRTRLIGTMTTLTRLLAMLRRASDELDR